MLFCAEIHDIKVVHNVLRAVAFKEFVVVRPLEEGLKLTLDEMKCIETSVYIPCHLFSFYNVNSNEDIVFKISLKVLTECLSIFGDDGSPSLKLTYESASSPLCLVMKHIEENITVDCEIKTMTIDDSLQISLANECDLNKIVISPTLFQELLHRLDNSADGVKLLMSPDEPYFKLTTTGSFGESTVTVSKNSDSVSHFQCSKQIESQYSFQNVRQVLKLMNFASKVSVATGESALLGLQFIINSEENQLFVEYYVTPMFED